jgi:hypothetical protein
MNSGGIALHHVQDVGQLAICFPPQWNMPIAQPWKEKGSYALRQVPVIATGDALSYLLMLISSRTTLAETVGCSLCVAKCGHNSRAGT